jgi:hypothetical protein
MRGGGQDAGVSNLRIMVMHIWANVSPVAVANAFLNSACAQLVPVASSRGHGAPITTRRSVGAEVLGQTERLPTQSAQAANAIRAWAAQLTPQHHAAARSLIEQYETLHHQALDALTAVPLVNRA